MSKEKKWFGSPPVRCDLCDHLFTEHEFFIDGRARAGWWAIMCEDCHKIHGIGLGQGAGQRYSIKTLANIGP